MSFRRIDIDAYDEDRVTEDELYADIEAGSNPQEIEAAVQSRGTEVRNLLQRGNERQALSLSLQDPPYGRNLDTAKSNNTQTVMDVLQRFRAADIGDVVKALSKDEQDVLMKYIYAGLAKPELFNPAVLLGWHEKLVEVAGPGSIVRVMTDRRTVV
ncbi:hypothetical protein BZG36_04749 [Bifiguratus adelaidae]|uniref:Actin-related protein 2/3 complex subunit 5 n=1 Tax=Bifiguratus adelaidae TaxID=1938954 RepID=A0A261XV32_9FUNG|nr:hypothetical protein BZG36_04749 [Bifiguratus adelaidae]